MTNTEEIELELCGDCVVVIANADNSGVEDPEGHEAGMSRKWADPSWRLVVTWASDDINGFGSMEGDTCDGCGRERQLLRGRGVAVREGA